MAPSAIHCQRGRRKRQQKDEGVAEADLGEGVFEGEVGLRAVHGAQKDAERNEQQAAPDGVQDICRRSRLCDAAGDGIRQRDADQESEGRLDHVVKAHACPFDVGLVEGEDLQNKLSGYALATLANGALRPSSGA